VQEVSVAQLVGRAGGGNETSVAIALEQVLDDGARFGHRGGAVGDHGRLAERVDGAQFRRRQHRLRVALVFFDLVLQSQFFEQPENALRARIVEVVDNDHRVLSPGQWRSA
jgi:hypothetical protein